MDLFLKISVLPAIFCWLGDVEVMLCPWKESIAGCLREFDVWNSCYELCQKPLPHPPPLPTFLLPPTVPPSLKG